MQNFNLANVYDKSLVDMHKLYVDTSFDVEEVYEPTTKKKPTVIVLSFVLMLTSAFATAYYLHLNRISKLPIERIPTIGDRKSSEENRGYVRVQVFEFDNESEVMDIAIAEPTLTQKDAFDTIVDFTPQRDDVYRTKVKDIYAMDDTAKGMIPLDNFTINPTDKNEKYPISSYKKSGEEMIKEILKEELSPKKVKTVQVASASYLPSVSEQAVRYSIQFNKVTKINYDTLRGLAKSNRLTFNVNNEKEVTPRWTIYKENDNGSEVINGFKASLIQSFDSNTDALEYVEYLKVDGGNFIIHVEDTLSENYNIKLCCTDIDNAKKIAVDSKITDGVIRIVREQ